MAIGSLLIVDDTPESLMFLADLLSAKGYEVITADNGVKALALLSENKPDLILLDIIMPYMDGFEVCRRIKENITTRLIPILFISSLSETSERVEGLRLGAVDYISKPFQREELLMRVQTHMELSQLRAGLERQVAERTDQLRQELNERRQAEEHARKALAEKEVLLRELHHRTKNNLQIISSLIAIEETYQTDEAMISILHEIRNRVHAMAMVHEKLYLSENLASIDLGSHIRDLAAILMTNYQMMDKAVNLIVQDDPLAVPVEIAIPCSLILNELISNALKYAFPDRAGSIWVTLKQVGDNISLSVVDNGIGYPGDFDPENSGRMGLLLVRLLGKNQLQGIVEFQTNHGFGCQLIFPWSYRSGDSQ
jgi:two-component sensor histidine kinase